MNSKYVNMITVPQAIKILSDQGIMPKTKSLMIADCLHLVSAAPIIAPVDVPGFDNSAMDGYVFCFEDYKSNQPLVIRNEIQAGTHSLHPLQKGEATRIFTGAPIPPNGDTVVPQELVSISNGEMHIQKEIAKYANIRPRGGIMIRLSQQIAFLMEGYYTIPVTNLDNSRVDRLSGFSGFQFSF